MLNNVELMAWIICWLATYWIHSTLLLGMVWLCQRWVHNPALQEALWKVALVGGVLRATLQLSIAVWNPVSVTTLSSPKMLHSWGKEDSEVLLLVYESVASIPSEVTVPSPTIGLDRQWYEAILSVWGIAVSVGLVRLAWQYHCLYRHLGHRTQVHKGNLFQNLQDLCQQLNAPIPTLTITKARMSPVLLPNGEICLPRSVLTEMPVSEQRGVLAHELAHKMRGDHYGWLLSHLFVILFPFQPLNRVAFRELRRTAEYLSDTYAVRLLETPLPLVNGLVRVATWLNQDAVPVPAMAVRPATLTERVQRLLQPQSFRPLPKWRLFSGVVAIVLMLILITPPVRIAMAVDSAKLPLSDSGKPIPTPTVRATRTPLNSALVSATATPRRTPLVRPTSVLPPVAVWPVDGTITVQPSHYHNAIDIAGEEGSPVVAAWDGTVFIAGYDEAGYGNRVVIKHDDRYETMYAHLATITVESWDKVTAGEVIGTRGATGRTPEPTLHFEVRKNGARVNPWNYLP